MHRRKAFTLVEILIVLAIVVILVAFTLPALARARSAARKATCLTRVHGLSGSLTMYLQDAGACLPYDYGNLFPAAATAHFNVWMPPLKPYAGNIDKLNQCPEVLTRNPFLNTAGTSYQPWNHPEVSLAHTGSYTINGWLYQAGVVSLTAASGFNGDEDSNSNDKDDQLGVPPPPQPPPPPDPAFLPLFFGRFTRTAPDTIPTFAEATWDETFPQSSDPAPPNLSNGTGTDGRMGQVCIARHDKAVNIVFVDGHSETVPLQKLWTLKWNAKWQVPNPLPTLPKR